MPKLQRIAEQAFGDRKGALVAIEPATGGILAMVSVPNYDPNLFVDGIDTQNWRELNESPDKPMVNRALNGAYPPGSTFKPFMALAALELGKRRPEQAISDPGFFNFGGHHFRDDKKGGHGMVDMYKSIVHSCDTYYYMLANDMGIDNIAAFMGQLGLGQRTGIDIDGESEGVLPSQEWKKKRFKKPEQQKWYAGETISIGIGQGYNAYTPIQLAQATATIANNGVMFRPHLVKYVTDTRTGDKRLIEPEPLRDLQLKPEHVEVIRNAMVGVNKEGTGARAFAKAEYVAAGKTGTAQVFSYKGADTRPRPWRPTCATMPCSSPSRRPTSRPSRWPCWSRTAASAPRRRRRSRARCSTTTCSARSPRRRRRRTRLPSKETRNESRLRPCHPARAGGRSWSRRSTPPLLLIAGLLVLLAVAASWPAPRRSASTRS
jgi:penicillin-binding protein 2